MSTFEQEVEEDPFLLHPFDDAGGPSVVRPMIQMVDDCSASARWPEPWQIHKIDPFGDVE